MAFPPNGYSVYDMIGNVWEWTTDWYSPKHEPDAAKACCIPENPRGGQEEASYDPRQPEIKIPRKVIKGGSHLCAPNYCRRYRPAARHAEPVDTSTSHLGFQVRHKSRERQMSDERENDRTKLKNGALNRRKMLLAGTTLAAAGAMEAGVPVRVAQAQLQPVTAAGGKKPNIILIVSDDFGYGDAGCYLGGEGRGMPTPNLDRLADEGMMFTSFYAQPSCTPGRAAMQTGRIPNRSGMTTVAFQGQGGGLPAAEWTLGIGAENRRLQHLLFR